MNRLGSMAMALGLLLAAICAGASDGDAERGAALFETCRGCHGVEGYYNVYPSYRVPKLGGQTAEYVAEALKSYQQGGRNHPTMYANSASLSERDIADIASYVEQYGR